MNEDQDNDTKKAMNPDTYMGLGIIFGSVVGVLTDNIGLWIALGVVFGAALREKAKKKTDDTNTTDSKSEDE